jgi:hypothetical protein
MVTLKTLNGKPARDVTGPLQRPTPSHLGEKLIGTAIVAANEPQVEGLFAAWTHTMKFDERGDRETLVTDLVDYQVPLGLLGFSGG